MNARSSAIAELMTGNRVKTNGGWIKGDVIGTCACVKSDVNGNAVEISSGTRAYNVYGGYTSTGTVSSNTVTITSGTVQMDVYGGEVDNYGNANSNTVTITGGRIGTWADLGVYGGKASIGTVSSNTVKIISGTIQRKVCGGYSNTRGEVVSNTVN